MSFRMTLSSFLSPEGKTQKPIGSKSLRFFQQINTTVKTISKTTLSPVLSTVKNAVVAVCHTKIPHMTT